MRSRRLLVAAMLLLCGAVVARGAEEATAKDAKPAAEKVAAEVESMDEADHGSEADHKETDHASSKPDPLAMDPDLALWTLGVFLLMLWVLKKLAWKPILDGLKLREEKLVGHHRAAEAKHEEAKRVLAEHQAKLAKAADEVKALLDEARRDAEATKAEIVAEAKAASEAERQRAVRDVNLARDAAVRQLAEQSATLAVELAKKVVRKELTADRQGEIVREALSSFGVTSSN